MKKIKRKRIRPDAHACAWCHKTIAEDSEVFGMGAKARDQSLLKGKEGTIIFLQLLLTDTVVPAMVTAAGSPAKQDGKDMMFMACSRICAESLKTALEMEKELFEEISS